MGEARPKLLFVISNDYGELSAATYFAMGGEFEVAMVLPPRLYASNQSSLPYESSRYESAGDVLEIIARKRPDVVLLFSGYLYAINGIFKLPELAELVKAVQNGGSRLVTSDPFLGLMSEIRPGMFSDRHPLKNAFVQHFSEVFKILKDVVHIYPADLADIGRTRNVGFFNAKIVIPADGAMGPVMRKRWLFVLSAEDYVAQTNLLGRQTIEQILIDRLRDAANQNRQPVVVAPEACIASIRSAAGEIPEAVLLGFCGLDDFRRLLLEAEYAFYWNILSNSILWRAANGLPTFFFDRGHMLMAIPAMYDLAMARYYAHASLPWLDQRRTLAGEELSRLSTSAVEAMSRAINNMRRLPDPQRAIDLILRGNAS